MQVERSTQERLRSILFDLVADGGVTREEPALQWGIVGNGRKPDPATPREGRRLSGCKLLLLGTIMTVPIE